MSDRNVKYASNTSNNEDNAHDAAFESLILLMNNDKSHIWNSKEIQKCYSDNGGTVNTSERYHRCALIKRLQDHFGEDLLVFSGSGVASIILFRSEAPNLFNITDDSSDDMDVTNISKVIRQQCIEKAGNREVYKTRLSPDDATEPCSDLLMKLLAETSPKLNSTNAAYLIGNIVASAVTNRPTPLQIILGTVIRDKTLIEQCAEFLITCSYDEVLIHALRTRSRRSHSSDIKSLNGVNMGTEPSCL